MLLMFLLVLLARALLLLLFLAPTASNHPRGCTTVARERLLISAWMHARTHARTLLRRPSTTSYFLM